jgi:uncharacterized protein YfaS (alpha-2-macroglobulin family)
VFSGGISFLKELATQGVSTLDEARNHAYAIYILTRNEIVTTNYLTNLQLTLEQHPDFDWKNDIISAYIAATYQMLKNTNEAEKLIAYFKIQTKSLNSENDFYTQYTANAQYVYLIAKHFPNRLTQIDASVIMSLVNALNDNTITTILSGYSSLALAAYNPSFPPISDKIPFITETTGNKESTLATEGEYKKAQVTVNAEKITFNNPGNFGLFYQLTQAGFDKNLPTTAIQQGIDVFREYRNAEDKVVTNVSLGEDMIVHIRVRANDGQSHSNIALVDLLPGGFEVARDSIQASNMDYVDVREDRVIFFGYIDPESKEMTYKVKATSAGKFVVPPLLGTAMYNPMIKSLSLTGTMTVAEGK